MAYPLAAYHEGVDQADDERGVPLDHCHGGRICACDSQASHEVPCEGGHQDDDLEMVHNGNKIHDYIKYSSYAQSGQYTL